MKIKDMHKNNIAERIITPIKKEFNAISTKPCFFY